VRQRIQNIFSHCNNSVDLILLKNASIPFIDDNFFYVTGLEQGLFEGCAALLHPSGDFDLLVTELEAESGRQATADIRIYKTKDEFSTELKRLITSRTTIGINASSISYHEFCSLKELFPKINFVDVSNGFSTARLIKDAQEIQRTKQACKIVDETMASIPDIVYEGMSESELAAEINYSLQNLGAEKPAFDTISSFGKNTAEPHYSHGVTTLCKGDFIVCDFGACYKKYNSDITRTFHSGKATKHKSALMQSTLAYKQGTFIRL
jgi:Xaa-Pro aminopeptidase